MDEKLLSTREVAERYGVRVQTLKHWRARGLGPPYLKVGGRLVRYFLADLIAHDMQQRRSALGDAPRRKEPAAT